MGKGFTSRRAVLLWLSFSSFTLLVSCQALRLPVIAQAASSRQQTCTSDVPASAMDPPQRVSPQFFGMHVNRQSDLSTLSVPVGTLRLWDAWTDWAFLCPQSPRTCNWSTLEAYLEYASANGIEVIYTFGRVPIWENPDATYQNIWATNVSDTADWENFIKAIVQHSNGRIKYWEIWNEPNVPLFWSGTNRQLIKLAQIAYTIIKAADPCAKVLLPPTGDPTWTDSYLEDGGGQYADIMTFHGYPTGTPENYVPMVLAFQSVFAANGYSERPVWDTEGNWVAGNYAYAGRPDYTGGPGEDAAWVARSLILQASMGIERFMWYGWDFCNDTPCYGNLWTPSTGTRPPGLAYRTTAEWLSEASIGTCRNVSTTVWSCPVSRDGPYHGEIIWDTSSKGSTYSVDAQYEQFRTLLTDIPQQIEGHAITVGRQPILIESRPRHKGHRPNFELQ